MADQPLDRLPKDLAELGNDRSEVPLRQLVRTLETRGYGPLLAVLAALMMLPLGAVPGFPAIVGLLFVLCGGQMLRGTRGVWLPRRVGNIRVPSGTLRASIDRVRPVMQKLRPCFHSRMTWATSGNSVRLIAVLVMIAGLAMIGLGFIPGLPILIALPVLIFGLGLTMGDGLVVVTGFALSLPTVWAGWAGL
jgi:hypothetical protein